MGRRRGGRVTDPQHDLFDPTRGHAPKPIVLQGGRVPGSSEPLPGHARAKLLRKQVLRQLELAGTQGLTADEAALSLSAWLYSIAPRLTELTKEGLATKGPDTRMTGRGAPADVYRITETGKAQAVELSRLSTDC